MELGEDTESLEDELRKKRNAFVEPAEKNGLQSECNHSFTFYCSALWFIPFLSLDECLFFLSSSLNQCSVILTDLSS
jgi:hypothetical protein